jgi:hypothetical protein
MNFSYKIKNYILKKRSKEIQTKIIKWKIFLDLSAKLKKREMEDFYARKGRKVSFKFIYCWKHAPAINKNAQEKNVRSWFLKPQIEKS